jgi:hypothetical protein
MPLTKIQSLGITDGTIVNADINASAAIAGTKLTGVGITEADQWRITTNLTGITTLADITANWERNDSTGYSVLGTGMTQSSGIFTFPSTGYYLIELIVNWQASVSATLYLGSLIRVTTNNSTYATVTDIYSSIYANSAYCFTKNSYIFDVTSTANCKVKFAVEAAATSQVVGNGDKQNTGATFIRLGDT